MKDQTEIVEFNLNPFTFDLFENEQSSLSSEASSDLTKRPPCCPQLNVWIIKVEHVCLKHCHSAREQRRYHLRREQEHQQQSAEGSLHQSEQMLTVHGFHISLSCVFDII